MRSILDYFWRILVSLDQLANVVFGPILNLFLSRDAHLFGDVDETLSSVLGKNIEEGNCRFCYMICKLLHKIDPEHCKKSIEYDEGVKRGVK